MAKIAEALTDSNPFLADSKETIAGLAALDSKAATLNFGKATYNAELATLREVAREAGFSLVKLHNVPKVETGDTITEGYKLRDKIVVAPHTRPNRAKKGDAAAEAETAPATDAVA